MWSSLQVACTWFSLKRTENKPPSKALTHCFEPGKRDFSCPFTWIKATPWGKKNQPLGEDLINIITPFRAKKTKKGIKKKLAQTKGP